MPETPTTTASGTDLASLADDFTLTMKSQNRSPATITLYRTAVLQFVDFAKDIGMPTTVDGVKREHVEAFMVHLMDTRSASTAKTRYGGLQAFFKWCLEEGEITASPMARTKPPHVPEQPVPVLTDDQVNALLASCAGPGFANRRDLAIMQLLIDTPMRRNELSRLAVSDVDLANGTALVLGKGGRYRLQPLGDTTNLALRRYLRERAKHPHANAHLQRPGTGGANEPEAPLALWVGKFGVLTDSGIQIMLRRRGKAVGITGLHAHQFRHTFAHEWLANGGTEGDLMQLAGWRNRQMLDRYGRSVAAARAIEAHRRMRPGDRR
jgi:integrase